MLILKKPFDDLWKGKDAFEEVEKISGEVYRSVATRETLRFEVDGKGYYLKLHHGITYKEFFKNVFLSLTCFTASLIIPTLFESLRISLE